MLLTKVDTKLADYRVYHPIIHRIRHEVFVKEQQVPQTLEIDSVDPVALHVLAWSQGHAAGTGRLAPDGKIGRVAVYAPMRGQGVGREIMQQLLHLARDRGHAKVKLSAQCHAIAFYQKLGFYTVGDVFEEVGIDHIEMVKRMVG
ncbi:MAG: GNAT family N-acetyltransferase [Cyanobacteria bacterium P01_H01_bin.119]